MVAIQSQQSVESVKEAIKKSKKVAVMSFVERRFESYGKLVARRPWTTIIVSLAICSLSALGLIRFERETNWVDLWVAPNSDSKIQSDWLNANFPPELRSHSIILTAENVLTPEVLRAMFKIRKLVNSTISKDNTVWEDHCKKIPVMKPNMEIDELCMEFNLLELFAIDGEYSEDAINQITQEVILHKVNNVNKSQIFHTDRNFTKILGGIKEDENGNIIGASSTMMKLFTTMNTTEAILNPIPETPSSVTTRATFDFEAALLDTLQDKSFYPEGLESSAAVQFSMPVEMDSAIKSGIPLLAVGFGIMYVYVLFMLGKFSIVEHRAWLTVPALTSVLFGIIFSVGICSAVGLSFTDFHLVMPLILLAIGIDDAFVVVGALDNLTEEEKKGTIEQRFGTVMKHAGVSITITSLTNIVAFGTGGITIIPGLSSFCIYCSVGLIAIYAFTISFFFATLVLKQQHVDDSRDGCFMCIKRDRKTPSQEETNSGVTMSSIFGIYSKYLLKTPVMVLVAVITFALLGVGTWKTTEVDYRFHLPDLLNDDSYMRSWFDKLDLYFPEEGSNSHLFVENLTSEDFFKLHNLVTKMKNEEDIISDVNQWTEEFNTFAFHDVKKEVEKELENTNEGALQWDLQIKNMPDEEFQNKLSNFLCSPSGAQFRFLFTFDEKLGLNCSLPAPPVLLVITPFSHPIMKESEKQISALHKIKKMVKDSKMSGYSFVHSEDYFSWETAENVQQEFPIELGVGLGTIFVLTICFLMSIKVAAVVMVFVVCSLINTIGFGYLWGLSLNLYTAAIFIMSTGLYIDYSVHVAHAFLQAEGTRYQRARSAITEIGPAVFNGGFSTFLAISAVAFSGNYVWRLFFKTFMMITFFGMFHGLATLPVVLSLGSTEKKETKTLPKEQEFRIPRPTLGSTYKTGTITNEDVVGYTNKVNELEGEV